MADLLPKEVEILRRSIAMPPHVLSGRSQEWAINPQTVQEL
jgi:hypothetical protein